MFELFSDFIVRSLLAGIGVAAVSGPLGALIVWQRMAYFGDALAHASLLGIALSLFLAIDITLGVLAVALLVAVLLVVLQSNSNFANDTLLGILSHSGLGLGLLCYSLLPSRRVDLLAYLYGDILAVTSTDLWVIGLGAIGVLLVLYRVWGPMLQYVIHQELAQVEGVPVHKLRFLFIGLLAFVVAIGIKIVGVLLMTAMLIIPAATARFFAKSPASLAVYASLLGILAVISGMVISLNIDVPTGPAMVVAMSALFMVCMVFKSKER